MEPTEPRYEAIEIIIRERTDGVSWFDYFFDRITENCEGTGTQDEEGNWDDCSCGLETMGGSSGTLEQCYEYGTNVAPGISPLMLAEVIEALYDGRPHESTKKVREWARHEIEVEEWFNNLEDEDAEEEETGD